MVTKSARTAGILEEKGKGALGYFAFPDRRRKPPRGPGQVVIHLFHRRSSLRSALGDGIGTGIFQRNARVMTHAVAADMHHGGHGRACDRQQKRHGKCDGIPFHSPSPDMI